MYDNIVYYLSSHIILFNNNIGGRNDFVDLKIRSINDGSVVVNCSFLDLKEFSRKSCSISYGPNKQMLIWSANGSSNLSFISLSLNGDFQDKTELFYVVTASNASFTLKVEGTLNLGKIHQELIDSKGERACNSYNYIIAPCIDYLSKFKPKGMYINHALLYITSSSYLLLSGT